MTTADKNLEKTEQALKDEQKRAAEIEAEAEKIEREVDPRRSRIDHTHDGGVI